MEPLVPVVDDVMGRHSYPRQLDDDVHWLPNSAMLDARICVALGWCPVPGNGPSYHSKPASPTVPHPITVFPHLDPPQQTILIMNANRHEIRPGVCIIISLESDRTPAVEVQVTWCHEDVFLKGRIHLHAPRLLQSHLHQTDHGFINSITLPLGKTQIVKNEIIQGTSITLLLFCFHGMNLSESYCLET